jgi:hypothetical protein
MQPSHANFLVTQLNSLPTAVQIWGSKNFRQFIGALTIW